MSAEDRDRRTTNSAIERYQRRVASRPSSEDLATVVRVPISDLEDAKLVRIYSPWAGRTPADAAEVFRGHPGRWWIAGGWAIESFTGVERHHADLDLEVPRAELSLLRQHLAGRLDVWTAAGGALRPLLPDDEARGAADVVLPA